MMHRNPRFRLTLAGVMIVGGILTVPQLLPGRVSRATAAVPPDSGQLFLLAGTASCSGRACHGGLTPLPAPGPLQTEYVTWVSLDKHADAYRALFNPRSRDIAKRLHLPVPAHEESRCLACHSTPQALKDFPAQPVHREERWQGVGCESCHGSAKEWLEPHTTRGWKDLTAAQKQRHGMIPSGDLAVRTQVCAGCHIGAPPGDGIPARNMNHDMIAAGHPQLHFELGSFLANMPRHWRKADDTTDAWAIGQVASAKSALELLAYRAGTTEQPWPEFAEYNCFACHHALLDDNTDRWRQKRGYGGRKPGALPWGGWYYSLLPALARQQAPAAANLLPDLEALAKSLSQTRGDRKAIARQAATKAEQMGGWLTKLNAAKYNRADLGHLLVSFAPKEREEWLPDWDSAEQLFLAYLAWAGPEEGEAYQEKLAALERLRAFPLEQDSPADGFRTDKFRKELGELLRQPPRK